MPWNVLLILQQFMKCKQTLQKDNIYNIMYKIYKQKHVKKNLVLKT